MALELKHNISRAVTLVADEFIDHYMVSANGEYVKVYLYLLRHEQDVCTVSKIADALNHTEADVNRALAYWERLGVILQNMEQEQPIKEQENRQSDHQNRVQALNGNEEFTQLIYVAQTYLKRIFTPKDYEVFAYLYDGLKMPVELLEYLVEYCVQAEHTSIRYLEKVAISWHEKGFHTVEESKSYAESFSKNSFAVMKAFGLSARQPGAVEKELITSWFHTLGFSKEMVVEACNRTLEATHAPNFKYADTILKKWHQAGVFHKEQLKQQDQAFLESKEKKMQTQPAHVRNPKNRFHNFAPRNVDYDAILLQELGKE